MKKLLTLLLMTVTSPVLAQTTPPAPSGTQPQKQQVVEVTKVDFLTMPKIVSTSLSTFGVSLGMTRQEAIEALKSFCPLCSIKTDNDSGEIKVTVKTGEVLAASIHLEQGEVDRVKWYPTMEKYLAGQSYKLLTPPAFTSDSALRLELLGREDNVTPEVISTRSATSQTQTFVYGKEGLRLEMTVARISSQSFTNMIVTLTKPARAR